MIVRLWRGIAPSDQAKEFKAYERKVGPPGYEKIEGNRGVFMLGRDLGEHYEIVMLTLWDSEDAIRAFAGDPMDKAQYYDRDHEFLIDPPEKVEHFEVLYSSNPGSGE
jgi:heme-degrading monooxygenase HmoA